MVLYHSEAWSSEQLQAEIVGNPGGIIVWCHSMVPKYDREREEAKVRVRYTRDRRRCDRGIWPRGGRNPPSLPHDSEEQQH